MDKLKSKVLICICVGFVVLYVISMWGLTNWKISDLHDSMHNDYMSAYDLLIQKSTDDNFLEQAETHLTYLTSKLASRDIYAVAVILDEQGNISVKSKTSDICFANGREATAVDLNRLANCAYDAQNAINNKNFPSGQKDASIASSGPEGYIQGWTLDKTDGNKRYLFMNAKFFEGEVAIQKMISRYVISFVVMGIICLFLCIITSRFVSISYKNKTNINTNPEE